MARRLKQMPVYLCLGQVLSKIEMTLHSNVTLYICIVLSELEGIAKGIRKDEKVAENAKRALSFLQNRCSSYPNVKCVTTRGSILPSVRFTSEEDYSKVVYSKCVPTLEFKISVFCCFFLLFNIF